VKIADVHALGHIAYTLLVGEAYWSEEAESAHLYGLLIKVIEGVREPASARALRRRNVELPEWFDSWMEQATEPLVEYRFDSAWDAIMELDYVVSAAPMPPRLELAGVPDRISLGRARNCDIVLRDPSVSKLHAHFRVKDDGKFDLVDRLSENGTEINGARLLPTSLRRGACRMYRDSGLRRLPRVVGPRSLFRAERLIR
jgi:hypothetical protein